MAKFKGKNDAADISIKNGVDWYHFGKMSLMTLMTSLKGDQPDEVKIGA